MLNVASPIPLYRQLADRLASAIESGAYAIGERIPSEHTLCSEYGVGRPTVRQATELLVRRGTLQRRRGAGTFVAARPEALDLFSAAGTLASFRRRGIEVAARLLDPVRTVEVEAQGSEDNPLVGRCAHLVRRLSSTSLGPVLLEESYLDPEVFVGLPRRGLGASSLSRLVKEGYGQEPTGGRQELLVAPVSGQRARALELEDGAPVLLVRRYLDFPRGRNAIYAELYHRSDRVVLTQELAGVRN